MSAHSPEDICCLFRQHMAEADMDSVLTLYDREVAFLNQAGEVIRGQDRLKQELSSLVATKSRFEYSIKQIVHTNDIALMHTHWTVSGPQQMKVYAIEVARHQTAGSWRWLIDDPFTVGREDP
ncbi:MAG: nuclear transport factor 2 family protein [Nitrospira sp.]|nr:nuclear transport factor 2 family protein [Nitrospira sp.]MDR4462658.1 nuclear transport factor 2 family protein [Nitrospira sp.]